MLASIFQLNLSYLRDTNAHCFFHTAFYRKRTYRAALDSGSVYFC